MGRRAATRRAVDDDVRELIEALALRGWTPTSIDRHLAKQPKFRRRAPSLRQVQRIVKAFAPNDPSGPWSLGDDDGIDARLVLPVLAAVIAETEGRKTRLTRTEATWIARIRTAVPDYDLWETYRLALEYMLRGAEEAAALDAHLAFLLAGEKYRERRCSSGQRMGRPLPSRRRRGRAGASS